MLQKFHDRNTPNRQKMNRTTLVYQMVALNMFFAFFNEKSLKAQIGDSISIGLQLGRTLKGKEESWWTCKTISSEVCQVCRHFYLLWNDQSPKPRRNKRVILRTNHCSSRSFLLETEAVLRKGWKALINMQQSVHLKCLGQKIGKFNTWLQKWNFTHLMT